MKLICRQCLFYLITLFSSFYKASSKQFIWFYSRLWEVWRLQRCRACLHGNCGFVVVARCQLYRLSSLPSVSSSCAECSFIIAKPPYEPTQIELGMILPMGIANFLPSLHWSSLRIILNLYAKQNRALCSNTIYCNSRLSSECLT